MQDLLIRTIALCLALASVETLHGIARAALLVPRIGKRRALRVSIVSGSLLAFLACWLLVPAMQLERQESLLLLGLVLALFMAMFDLFIGRIVMRLPWPKILRDFNPASGNYLLFGLILLVFLPALVMVLH